VIGSVLCNSSRRPVTVILVSGVVPTCFVYRSHVFSWLTRKANVFQRISFCGSDVVVLRNWQIGEEQALTIYIYSRSIIRYACISQLNKVRARLGAMSRRPGNNAAVRARWLLELITSSSIGLLSEFINLDLQAWDSITFKALSSLQLSTATSPCSILPPSIAPCHPWSIDITWPAWE